MELIHNERTKFTANLMNALCVAFLASGVIAPLVATMYGINSVPQTASNWRVLSVGFAYFLVGSALHLLGKRMLKGLLS